MIDRRAFLATAAGLLAAPPAAGAQKAATIARIGLLDLGDLGGRASLWDAFRQGMRGLGYVDGRTVVFESRGADRKRERLPVLAAELVGLQVDVIVAAGPYRRRRRASGNVDRPHRHDRLDSV